MLVIAIVLYVLGFVVNGFVSGSLYKQAFFPRTSPGWQREMLLACVTVPGSVEAMWSRRHHARRLRGTLRRVAGARIHRRLPAAQYRGVAGGAGAGGAAAADYRHHHRPLSARKPQLPLSSGVAAESHPSGCLLREASLHLSGERSAAVRIHLH